MESQKQLNCILHKLNNSNQKIMLNIPIIKAAWNDAALKLRENEINDVKLAGMPYDEACHIISELIETIENSSLEIKNAVVDFRHSISINT